jgi:hypothetical protein
MLIATGGFVDSREFGCLEWISPGFPLSKDGFHRSLSSLNGTF